jgi:hypothetical protein
VQWFGAENLHSNMVKSAEKDGFASHWFIHCVYPNEAEGYENGMNKADKPFLSIYLDEENKHECAKGGYWEFPYQVARWSLSAGEIYGRGLGETNIADVKMLNRMGESTIKAAQKIADPPLAAPDEGVIKAARTWPGGITYGAIDHNGNQLLRPLFTGGNINISLDMIERQREMVREGFYFSLMQMLQQGDMTATEWTGRQEEKFRLMGPNLGRIQSEFLSPLIARRFGILYRAGKLPPPPQEAQGVKMRIKYVSPLARAQQATEANAIIRVYQGVGVIAQFDPTVLDNFNHDEAAKKIADGFGAPAVVLRSDEDVQDERKHRAMQQNVAAGAQLAQSGATTLKTITDASKSGAASAKMQSETPDGGKQAQGQGQQIGQLVEALRGALRGKAA